MSDADKVENVKRFYKEYFERQEREGVKPLHPGCEDHEWISIKNEHITSGEMCLTCYQNGKANIPLRKETPE